MTKKELDARVKARIRALKREAEHQEKIAKSKNQSLGSNRPYRK